MKPNNNYLRDEVRTYFTPDQLRSAVKPVRVMNEKKSPKFGLLGLLVGAAAAVIVFWIFLILALV